MSIELLKNLAKPLSEEAIQRTFTKETKKGYDTTGYAYQYAVDRFNDTLGKDWGYDWNVLHEEQGKFRDKEYKQDNGAMKTVPGATYWDITVNVEIWIEDSKPRSCAGHHISTTYGDALKGAITNGFKKAAAFWGVGRDAFAGTIDDDNKPYPDSAENKVNEHFGQPKLDKMKDLPQDIKDAFAALGYRSKPMQALKLCEDLSWNNDNIRARLNSLANEGK
jgi:hypothetical protein